MSKTTVEPKPNYSIGKRIRAAREAVNWTQDDLVRASGLSKGFISDVENGKSNLSVASLIRLSDTLRSSVEWLVRGHRPAKIKCPLCGGKGKIQL
jgi:transcriptional regulator with XRE-family HTH domain